MLFIDTTAQPRDWLHLGMADFPFPRLLSQARFEFYVHKQLFQSDQVAECLWKPPKGLRKSVLAFMLVILQVKGILIYISPSDLRPAKGKNLVQLAARLFWTKSELYILTIQVKFSA